MRIQPVILSGGAGSRLWPLSREAWPKQLLPLAGDRTLLQDTARRVNDPQRFLAPMVVANVEHRFGVADQLQELGLAAVRILLEPVARNTAAAVAAAALTALADDGEAILLVMPADHVIGDPAAFSAAVDVGLPLAQRGEIVLFGVRATGPATGYGYIRPRDLAGDEPRPVAAFVEKPDLATAQRLLDEGALWNSGIFLLSARAIVDELQTHAPAVVAAVEAAVVGATRDLDFCRLEPAAFARSPALSLDHAVLERTARAWVVPCSMGWSDVGSWAGLWSIAARDDDDNVRIGDVVAEDTHGAYLRSEGPLIATVGVEDLVVIATPDAVLVTRRGCDQQVKLLVDRLKARNHASAVQARRVFRPWGWYEGLHAGERFQVKRITVKPGGKLSLQRHVHRAEHWVVVNGTAEVQVGDVSRLVTENESVFIPLGATHRVGNPGKLPLNLIEVQSGGYLGEDDIVRLDDVYRRD